MKRFSVLLSLNMVRLGTLIRSFLMAMAALAVFVGIGHARRHYWNKA